MDGVYTLPLALALPALSLVLCVCLPAVKSKAAKRLVRSLCWPSVAAIGIGAAALADGAPVLAGWLCCGGLAALVVCAGLLSDTDYTKEDLLRVGQGPPDQPTLSPSGMRVDWERFEAEFAAWAATEATRPGPDRPVGRDTPPPG